jgi:hypothetical protein
MQVTALAVSAFQAGHEGSIPFARSQAKVQVRAGYCVIPSAMPAPPADCGHSEQRRAERRQAILSCSSPKSAMSLSVPPSAVTKRFSTSCVDTCRKTGADDCAAARRTVLPFKAATLRSAARRCPRRALAWGPARTGAPDRIGRHLLQVASSSRSIVPLPAAASRPPSGRRMRSASPSLDPAVSRLGRSHRRERRRRAGLPGDRIGEPVGPPGSTSPACRIGPAAFVALVSSRPPGAA